MTGWQLFDLGFKVYGLEILGIITREECNCLQSMLSSSNSNDVELAKELISSYDTGRKDS